MVLLNDWAHECKGRPSEALRRLSDLRLRSAKEDGKALPNCNAVDKPEQPLMST
jgi:hypothetical protein